MSIASTARLHAQLLAALTPRYAPREARAVARLYLETAWKLSPTDVLLDRQRPFAPADEERWAADLRRLRDGEPVQYVVGSADFCGLSLRVAPAVLIPRPETEGLVEWAAATAGTTPCRILDAGTGSGCIAIAIALRLPSAVLTAWDLSPEALAIAHDNARRLGASVAFCRRDILAEAHSPTDPPAAFDLLVSNPPYICRSEAADMEPHVIDHEPHAALFVPDADPLCFYRALARLGQHLLAPGGALLVETHSQHADAVAQLFEQCGYHGVSRRCDCFSAPRMVKALR